MSLNLLQQRQKLTCPQQVLYPNNMAGPSDLSPDSRQSQGLYAHKLISWIHELAVQAQSNKKLI